MAKFVITNSRYLKQGSKMVFIHADVENPREIELPNDFKVPKSDKHLFRKEDFKGVTPLPHFHAGKVARSPAANTRDKAEGEGRPSDSEPGEKK
jgi:hypothetical protein